MWDVGSSLFSGSSDASKGGFSSAWVDIVGPAGGGENNHLSSLRNGWGGNVGVYSVGYLFHLPIVPQVPLVMATQVKRDYNP